MVNKPITVLLASVALSGCGGGGGGGGKSPAPELIRMTNQVVSIGENSSGSLTFTSSANDLAFDVVEESQAGLAAITLTDGALRVEAGDTDRPALISGVLYSVEKGRSHSSSKEISVVIENTSARTTESQVENLLEQRDDLLNLSEDKAVLQFVLEASYLSSLINNTDKTAFIDGFRAQDGASYSGAVAEINSLDSAFQSYQKGEISDVQLAGDLADADVAIRVHGDYATQKLTDIQSYSDVFFGDLTQTDLNYDAISGRYSRYLGQSTMGSYSAGDQWSFSSSFALLDALITESPSDPILVCEAD